MQTDAETARFKRTEAMGEDKITKLLIRFSGPAILAAETSAFYNLFDAIWCGRLSTEAVAALTVANPLMAIYRAIGAGIGVGTTSLIARHLGAGRREETDKTAGCSISFFFLLSNLVAIICLINLKTLLQIFGADSSVLPYAESYMFIETVFLPLDFFLVLLVELIRVGGNPSFASTGMIIASLMDLVFSPILVFGIWLFPALGIAGAALGTTVGRGVGVSILLAYIILGKSIYRFKPSYFRLNFRTIYEIYRVGISQTVRASAASLSQAIANNIAASFGVATLAVLGVLFKVNMVVFSFCMGVGQGMLPLVGYNFGAKKKERVGEAVLKAGLISFSWGALCWIIVMLFPNEIIALFGTDPKFLVEGVGAIRIFAFSFFAMGLQSNLSFFFQGIGRGIPSLIIASSRQLIFLIPCLLIAPGLFGLTGLWMSYPIADALAITLSLAWTISTFHSLKIPLKLRSSINYQTSSEADS